MFPHGTKGSSKKASKSASMTLNGPRMSSKKKRKLLNENSDPDVLDRSSKYWHGLKIDASDDINEKILKCLSAPSHRYRLKEDLLPAKKKRKLQKNGSLETDSDEEKNSKKGRLQMKKKLLRKLNIGSKTAAISGTKNKSKKSASGYSCGKGKKSSRQKMLSVNYEDVDGVCIYDLDTPNSKNKTRKKKLMTERVKSADHLLNKKARVGKGVLTAKNLTKMQKTRLRIDAAKFSLLPKKQQKELQRKYFVQLVNDAEASDSDNIAENNISSGSCKQTKIAKAKWADLSKKAKIKHLQDLELPKSKKLKRRQVSEEEDDDDSEDDDLSSEEEELSDDDLLEDEEEDLEDEDKDDDEEEEGDDDDDGDEEEDDSSDEQTSDEKLVHHFGLSNGDWEKVNEEQIQEVNEDAAYGNGWKVHEGEKPSSSSSSSSSSLLHPWSQNNGISANDTYHHDPVVSQQQQHHQSHQLTQAGNMAAGCMPAQTISRPMTNTSNLLPAFGTVVDTATTQQHYSAQDSSAQSLQHFSDQQQQASYTLYSGVDYTSQAPNSYSNDGKPSAQSQNLHIQHHLLQSQTHAYSGFNPLQSQQNNSSNGQKIKYYYPACIGKDGILEVERALQPQPSEEVLTNGFRINIKRCDMTTLIGSNWLNDEIINFYMNLIVQRGKTEGFCSVYIPSTFFFPMVMKRGYSGVRRWTKNVDIFDHDLMLIPIHLEMENHWTLIAVDFLQSSICYYDSYLQDKDEAMDAILDYLKEEMKAKKNIEMDVNCWVKVNMKNIPLQDNLSDCGVFSCIYAEYISRGAQMDFTQEDMPYFRRKMVYEILHQKILEHSPRDTENMIADDILEDTCPAPNDMSNHTEPTVALQNGLPKSLQSPTANDTSIKASEENAGLTVKNKDFGEGEGYEEVEEEEVISKDSDVLQSSSDVEAEQKMSTSADEEFKKKYSAQIVAEIKRIANLFEDADTKEQEILLNQLRHLQKSYSRILKWKNKHKHKVGHKGFKDLVLSAKGDSETEESDDLSNASSTLSSSSNSSSGSTSSLGGSSEEETKSSDEENMSSNSDNRDQLKLNHVTWEVEKLLMSFTDVIRSIGKASNRPSVKNRLLDPSGSFSVIKGVDYISSELQNISNQYNLMSGQSPKNTAAKKHVIPLSNYATKEHKKNILQCIASQLSVRHKNFQNKNILKQLRTQKAWKRTKVNRIPKKVASGYRFYRDEMVNRKLLSPLIKDVGGHLLKDHSCMRKLRRQENFLAKFPLPDESFDLACSTSKNCHKQQVHKNLFRSDHDKKGKKKK